ncbi:GNAT family N-acetyltransferase [Roseomonas aerophila]|uniref:GNAT family N-acetyltransferase n=2 Tax=Teichococcus aerophilus TaxID=1224513 RepID=A0ABR7RRD8_9PROT|nr:GNAT family N-acetyltransferase [Pseudoroseomonas aerophila]
MPPRPLLPADMPGMAALHAAAFPPAEAWDADALSLMLGLEGGYGFVVENTGFILARAVAGEAEVLTLAVAPAARRAGTGRALLAAALDGASTRGAHTMFLEVSRNNTGATSLYLSAGFTEVGLRRRYYSDGSDALVLRRDLSAG